ncbi:MAG: Na(+)-translocating NADH-quinone reductase subunit C [bacterium]|nr:Na(+)-translocating NADH-quinone reductase subunit C [bacterium]
MSTDTIKKTIGVALGVCIVCSVLVSTAAVYLKPKQEANKALEKRKNILKAGGLLKEDVDIEKVFSDKIHTVLVDLATGSVLAEDQIPANMKTDTYDLKRLAKDATDGKAIPGDKDIAGIKRIPTHSQVYFVKENNQIVRVIFPVHGKGLWSTMYGFFALEKDLETVGGMTFYEHGETPGLGGEIDNLKWQTSWKGKAAFDKNGKLQLKFLKGKATPGSTVEIDGLSGATLTSRGVQYMMEFWFGSDAYGPFLGKLRKEGIK